MPVMYKRRPNTEIDHMRRQLFADYWADDLVSGAAQLLRLQKAVRRDLPRIRSKMLVVVGSEDATVPLSVAPYIERRALGLSGRIQLHSARPGPGRYSVLTLDMESKRLRLSLLEPPVRSAIFRRTSRRLESTP